MSNKNIINEIKKLMAEGLHAKSMMNGSDYAIEKLREATALSEQINNTIWSNIPKYRLSHLLLRNAVSQQELEEIHNLLSNVIKNDPAPKLTFLCQVLLLTTATRLKAITGREAPKEMDDLLESATRNLRRLSNNGISTDKNSSNMQGDLFNLLELAVYFSGQNYLPLESLAITENYIELVPLRAPVQTLWRVVNSDGNLDAFAYSREQAEEELDTQLNVSDASFHYVYGNGEFKLFSRVGDELKFSKYDTDGNALKALVYLHGRQPHGITQQELLSILNDTSSGDKTLVLRQTRSAIRKALGAPSSISTSKKIDRLDPEIKIIGLVSQNHAKIFR